MTAEDDARRSSCEMHEQALSALRDELANTRASLAAALIDRDRWIERMKLLEKRQEAAIKCLRP